jgi:hypothetical protein
MTASVPAWSADSICMRGGERDVDRLAALIYRRVCRVDFSEPGFCLLNLGSELDSSAFRRLMVDLKRGLAAQHAAATGETLIYISAGRFDQQTTTRPHRDGGPEQSLLLLGYEPSEVESVLEISDYSRCAFELGITPQEFLNTRNPMFRDGFELLRPYATQFPCFSRTNYQFVAINNSSSTFAPEAGAWQGTLHTATIPQPDEKLHRVINSTMVARAPAGTCDVISEADIQDFIMTAEVRGKKYG